MSEIILTGNPNAGKTTLFNKLTYSHGRTGNWQGVTVSSSTKRVGENVVTDLPGLYALDTLSMEESVSADYILSHRSAVFVQVIECSALKRSLKLTKDLIENGIYPIIVLTKRKYFYRKGGKIDICALSSAIGLPVYFFEDFNLSDALKAKRGYKEWGEIKGYEEADYSLSKAERILAKGYVAIPVFFLVICLIFYLCFAPGSIGMFVKNKISEVLGLFSDILREKISSPFVEGFVCDCIIGSVGNVLGFLPQLALLFGFLIALEESGFMSFVAFSLDDFLKFVGLNGRAVFSIVMGFGCTAASVISTRGQQIKSVQRRTVVAMQFIPCSARLPVLLTLLSSLSRNPFIFVVCLYAMNIIISVFVSSVMKGGEREELFLEIPPLCLPNALSCLKSLLFRLNQFIIKVATVMLGFMAGVWLLSSVNFRFSACAYEESILASVSKALSFLFRPMGVDDWRITLALFSGLAAKENIAGVLAMFYPEGLALPVETLSAVTVFVMLCPPCVSCLSATIGEIGKKAALSITAIQLVFSLLFSYFVRFCFMKGFLSAAWIIVAILLLILGKNIYEGISRKRKNNFKKIYRQ